MLKEAVLHRNSYEYVYPSLRNRLNFKLRTGREDIKDCKLICFPRTDTDSPQILSMKCFARDHLFDYFETSAYFSKVARYQKYYFELVDAEDRIYYYSAYGITRERPEDGYFEFLYANRGDVISVPDWAKGIVYYQIFPERFKNGDTSNDPKECVPWGSIPDRECYMGGDLRGIIQKLDYLKSLSVDCLYLTPIFKADFNHKYATQDYYDVDPMFGSRQDLKDLIEGCHRRGMRIILDGVFNHTGIHFGPFEDLLEKQEKSAYKEWFYVTEYPVVVSHSAYECVGAYKWMPKLNTSNAEVKKFIINVMEYWIDEFGIDGWRLDVADEVDGGVWEEAHKRIRNKKQDVLLLGETWSLSDKMLEGNQLDSIMNYFFRDTVCDYFAKDKIDVDEFDHRLNQMYAAYHREFQLALYNLLDSHDTARFLSESGGDKKKLKLAAAFQFIFPGSPAIYYGDEIGMEGDNDPDCRRGMIWEEEKQDKELFRWYCMLSRLRQEEKALKYGNFHTNICDAGQQLFGCIRKYENEVIYAVFSKNYSKTCVQVPLLSDSKAVDLIGNEEYAVEKEYTKDAYNGDILEYKGKVTVELLPYSMKVIKQIMEV